MTVDAIDALVLSGGSAMGLGTADGVVQWLRERERGVPTPAGVVPIVPTACIYDLAVGVPDHPPAADAYRACDSASEQQQYLMGAIGAGTGASVGKVRAAAQPMSSGLGCAEIATPQGLQVGVCAVVNPVGDVLDQQGNIPGRSFKSRWDFF